MYHYHRSCMRSACWHCFMVSNYKFKKNLKQKNKTGNTGIYLIFCKYVFMSHSYKILPNMALLVVIYSLRGGQKWLSAASCQTSDSQSVEAFEV